MLNVQWASLRLSFIQHSTSFNILHSTFNICLHGEGALSRRSCAQGRCFSRLRQRFVGRSQLGPAKMALLSSDVARSGTDSIEYSIGLSRDHVALSHCPPKSPATATVKVPVVPG